MSGDGTAEFGGDVLFDQSRDSDDGDDGCDDGCGSGSGEAEGGARDERLCDLEP
ncbi:MAG: hypothetical protein ACSHX9_05375 [Luteolibacter sp.]